MDTGLDLKDPRFASALCPTGHKDFTGTGIVDRNGHGTHVAGLIKQYAGDSGYCLLIYKYYDHDTILGEEDHAFEWEVTAFSQAIKDGADVVNFSGGGTMHSLLEYNTMRRATDTIFVVAAGNNGQDLDTKGNEFYPASYRLPNTLAVGNLGAKSSNYAPWLVWEVGENVLSTVPGGLRYLSGTSMATAIRTGKLVKRALDSVKERENRL